jgi:Family of unknown function (DUF6176)
MSQLQLLKIRIKPGRTEKVVRFIQALGHRHAEVTEAFRREGMHSQSFFLERHADGDWLYYLARADDLMTAALEHEKSHGALASEARELMETSWADIHAPELIGDLVMQGDGRVLDQLPSLPEFGLQPLEEGPALRKSK